MFGQRLLYLRKKHDLLQKELGDKLGVTKGAIGMWENNKRTPDFDMLKSIADFFDVSIDYLLGETDHPNIYKVKHEELQSKVQDVDEEYMTLAKEMQKKKIPPKKIYKMIELLNDSENE